MHDRARGFTWLDASGTGHDDVAVTIDPSGCTAVGHVIAHDPERFEIFYRVECDAAWRTRFVSVADTLSHRSLDLHVTPDSRWVGDDGEPLPELDGAIDVDISATPFSNTLPVRRLDLEVGESRDIVTAYIDVPSLHVTPDPQRYTRVEPNVYRYESLDSDFVRDVEVDDDGFVLEYPGLFRRLGYDPRRRADAVAASGEHGSAPVRAGGRESDEARVLARLTVVGGTATGLDPVPDTGFGAEGDTARVVAQRATVRRALRAVADPSSSSGEERG
ncbi:putative glycolipid-binding domain-containing protein [Herbiconiux sp. KACC 21604]|uniref:putative glycolipid-binding domain-containing protein n=1 Tax=unclassified Herbiconiux TaxID=2618217 RepID=UPI0014911614|nr:putative glycolipid-binding domain-containing protein [Herbiconiux sp. SALV-R1]QJU54173.1 putative glycolipid-binding domain-containing protein [Herbiconiux sp. SALV-R1]WPO85226.1 putative glycolipid-binding domain-containing protein [Herbiconiux sp. KACC 21604]